MKNIFLLLACTVFSVNFTAQITQPHQTIAYFKVSYKAVPQSTANVASGVQGIAQATLNLKPNTTVSKVYFKILDKTTNAIIYQVNYNTNSSVITNNDGKKLFENSNNLIFISNGQALPIKPYIYQLQTEDNQSNLSTIYSVIQ